MESFAIDLDAVLDEFEQSESCNIQSSSSNTKQQKPSFYYLLPSNMRSNGCYDNQQDKLDLSAADFSASTTSLTLSENRPISIEPRLLTNQVPEQETIAPPPFTSFDSNVAPALLLGNEITNQTKENLTESEPIVNEPLLLANELNNQASLLLPEDVTNEPPEEEERLVAPPAESESSFISFDTLSESMSHLELADANEPEVGEHCEVVGFESDQEVEPEESDLDSYLKGLELVDDVILTRESVESLMDPNQPIQCSQHLEDILPTPQPVAVSSSSLNMGGARPKVKPQQPIAAIESESEESNISNDEDSSSLDEDSLMTPAAANSKFARPTSLNLLGPIVVNQNNVSSTSVSSEDPTSPQPQVEHRPVDVQQPQQDEVVECVVVATTQSPSLSETDSALPPSPPQVEDEQLVVLETVEREIDEQLVVVQEPEATESGHNLLNGLIELTEDEQLLGKIRPFWIPDEEAPNCLHCDVKFTVLKRRHHCRGCGKVLCSNCCNGRTKIAYLEEKIARVCQPCLATLEKVSSVERSFTRQVEHRAVENNVDDIVSESGSMEESTPPNQHTPLHRLQWPPNPNNPVEYCSQVSPLAQADTYSTSRPPPVVMVPVGVLKRGDKPASREPKQVMFSDGIRPGGDLTELDLLNSPPQPKMPSGRRAVNRIRRNMDKTSPVGPLRSPQHSDPVANNNNIEDDDVEQRPSRLVIYDNEGPLPPMIHNVRDFSVDDKPDCEMLLRWLQDPTREPVVFALTKNLTVKVKIIKLDCCLHKQVWCFSSSGLNCVGQDEVMFLLERLPDETCIPRDSFTLFTALYDNASAATNNPVQELGHLLFPEGLLSSRDHGAFLFLRPTFQCLSQLIVPKAPYLVALLLQKWEVPWAKVFPLRLMLRIGAEFRYYPCPLMSVRFRKPVFAEIGHTIMSVLADFRNYQYSLPTIPGVKVQMEDKRTSVTFPRNRYNRLMKVVGNSSNEHVLGLGATFSSEADSHLVCVQDEQGNYQTQAINIQNTTRKVTGASFIVFSGALKSTSGLTAKSSIVEDGLLVQITPDMMAALKNSFTQMTDFTIDCGRVDAAEPEERVLLKWVEDDANVNIGVTSPLDGTLMDGIESIRIANGTDYYADRHLIRWTQVFFLRPIKSQDSTTSHDHTTNDPSKMADSAAQACCLALVGHLSELSQSGLTEIGLRVCIDSEQVGYEIGSNGRPLPNGYLVDLDTALIPVITSNSNNNNGGGFNVELIFHVMRK